MLNGGYFDIGTPFYEGIYEMQHLTIPPELQKNIEYAFYNSGHMVYAHEDARQGDARQGERLHPAHLAGGLALAVGRAQRRRCASIH